MPGAYTLEWKDGRTEKLFGHRGYYYVFPDGITLSFWPYPAWCHHCGQIRLCEHLRGEAAIREDLATISDPKLEVKLRHAMLRRSPPACLHCGYRAVAYFTEGQWAPHPGTGEEVLFSFSGMCSTDFAVEFYDVDCNPLVLTEEQKAGLWEEVRKRKAF